MLTLDRVYQVALDHQLESRMQTTPIKEPQYLNGYSKRYARMVSSADKGATVC